MSEHQAGEAQQSRRDALRGLLVEFIQAPDSALRRRLLEASPELLGEEAEQVLSELAGARSLMSEESGRRLDEAVAMLREYRERGGQRAGGSPGSPGPAAEEPKTSPAVLADLLAQLRRENPQAADELSGAMATLLGQLNDGPRSRAETVGVICEECHHAYDAETWVIVDARERLDLAAKCRDGTIHEVECPACGRVCSADAPLLFHDGPAEQLVLAVQDSTTVEEDREVNRRLLGELYPHLVEYWDRNYLETTRVVPGIVGLQMLLEGHDPRLALSELLGRVMEGASTPEAAQERMSQLAETLGDSPKDEALLDTVWSFVRADSWADSKRVVDEHPELLSEDADKTFASMIGIGRLVDEEATESLTEHRDLLRRCREIGVTPAFGEKMGLDPSVFGRLTEAIAGLPPGVLDAARESAQQADSPEEALGALLERDDIRRTLADAIMSTTEDSGPEGLLSRGNFLERQGFWEEAADNYAEALAAFEDSGDERGQVAALTNLGDVFGSRGQYDMAISLYQRAARSAESLGNSLAVAATNALIAGIHMQRGDYDKADELFRGASVVIEAEGDKRDIAALYNNMAALYQHRGDIQRAESLYEQVISIHAELNEPDRSSAAYTNLGGLYALQNQDDKALDMFNKALTIERKLGHEAEAAKIYNNIAIIYERKRDYSRALEMYEKSLEICERLGADPQVAGVYLNMSGLHAKTGDRNQAIVDLQRALEIAERIGDKETVAMAYFNLGLIYEQRREKAQAMRYFRRARDVFVQMGDKQQEALVTVKIALLGEQD